MSIDLTNGTNAANNKEELVIEIRKLLFDILHQHTSEFDEKKQWLSYKISNPSLLNKIEGMTLVMLHVLDAIGRLEPVNSITISKDTNIPKGTVSKIIPKLISKKFITKEALPNNKKEYLFHITPLGKELFNHHEVMHKENDIKIFKFLNKYKTQNLQFLIEMLIDFKNEYNLNAEHDSNEE